MTGHATSRTAAPDLLARLLDVLGDSVAAGDTSGEDVAARAHLSRFHFDRVVSAVLGEAPGAFRRRVLLERAAHALSTTDGTVLDVAVAAGYSSHEAFTRAFARAYGETPTALRRRSRSGYVELEVPCPSGVHYQPPGGLRLPAEREVTEMELLTTIVSHHVDTLGQVLERAGRLPEEVLDQPITLSVEAVDDDMTLRNLLQDMVTQEEHWLSAARGGSWPDDSDRTVDGLAARHAVAGPAFVEFVRQAVEKGRLGDTFVDTTCDPPATHTFGGIVAHVITFGAVRRTIALGALASAGVEDLGSGDPRDLLDAAG